MSDEQAISAEAAAKRRKGRRIMLGIVAIFVLPFLVLPLLMSPEKMGKTNKGTLIDPAVAFSSLHASDASGQILDRPPVKKWFMFYVLPAHCEGSCIDARDHALFTIRQMPLTLGHDGDRVVPLVVETGGVSPELLAALQQIKALVLHADAEAVDNAFASVLAGKASEAGNLYLMSPDGYVFIRYAPQADEKESRVRAEDIRSDLKKSLTGSRI